MRKPAAGRPEGKPYPIVKQLRLKMEDAEDLKHLARQWRTSESEAARRAIREAAKREGLE
jgi:hypothetical protein